MYRLKSCNLLISKTILANAQGDRNLRITTAAAAEARDGVRRGNNGYAHSFAGMGIQFLL